MSVKGVHVVKKRLVSYHTSKDKAMEAAIKVELFRLKDVIKSGIQGHDPGAEPYKELTSLGRYTYPGRFIPSLPYGRSNFKTLISYEFVKNGGGIGQGSVGWLKRTGPSLRNLMEQYQKGATRNVTKFQREYFARIGGALGRRSRLKRHFFLKKTTTQLVTPPRQVIAPVFRFEKGRIMQNVKNNFRLKMMGRKI